MCGIVVIHYSGAEFGGAVQNAVFPHFSWFFTHFLNAFCVPLVNCFVLITGYFLIEKKTFSLKKPVSLLIITAFYGIISYAVAALCGGDPYQGGILYALFPYFYGNRWFVETYVILILLAPFISKLLRSLKREHYRLLLTVQLVIFCVWYSVGLSAPVLDDGYGIINFLTLYMLGGYIRLYGVQSKWLSLNKGKDAAVFAVCGLATFVLSYFINPYGYAFITNIVGSVAAFLFFLKWDIGTNKVVNRISEATFDVYFVHSDVNTSHLFIYELLGAKLVADTPWMILHVLLVIVAMWALGFLTYNIRKRLFSITIDRWLNKIKFIARCEEI